MNGPVHDPCFSVLVVEDSDDFRMLASVALSAVGYTAVCAVNGRDALDYLRSHRLPDAIVLDVSMPIMSGHEFRREQSTDSRLSAIPVVLYSCESNLPYIARDLHADAYVSKAESPRLLVEAVRRCCRRHHGLELP